ncbi:MAG: Eco57I restriction-modification methylase domain-containing protein, partial [Clostridia bacterium]|nr:Eco57I restriction-modification methylase domain-containing protein [Clostridia bacterium]
LNGNVSLNVVSFAEPDSSFRETADRTAPASLRRLKKAYANAKESGSLIKAPAMSAKERETLAALKNENVRDMLKQTEILSLKYHVVATNPPYLSKYSPKLKAFVQKSFGGYKGDLFGAFMYRCPELCVPDGYAGFMTPMVWMTIKTYSALREYIIREKFVTSLIQFDYSAFGDAAVPLCAFVLKNGKSASKGVYIDLGGFRGGMEKQREKALEAISCRSCGYLYEADGTDFLRIPGSPVAYKAGASLLGAFDAGEPLKQKGDTRQGLATSDNERFLRLWFEVSRSRFGDGYASPGEAAASKKKWFPYNKGGEYRKWYGNMCYAVNYGDDGKEIKEYAQKLYVYVTRTVKSMSEYFRPCISWSKVSSGRPSFRYYPEGFVFDVAGCCIFFSHEGVKDNEEALYILGFLNSSAAEALLGLLSPTMNYEAGHIAALPVIYKKDGYAHIASLVRENTELCRRDHDSFETSWGFEKHPLV